MNQSPVAEFCYLCFECHKNLRDLLKSEEECLELVAKLRVCVSEVDWNYHKRLLVCDKCVRKLNKAHEFKKQCIQSSETLKLYLSEIEKSKEKIEKREEPLVLQYLNLIKDDKSVKKPPPISKTQQPKEAQIIPAITKIVLTNQNSSFQNVFLNLLPQNIINKANSGKNEPNKQTFINLSQVIQLPLKKEVKLRNVKAPAGVKESEDVSKLLNEGKTEEVSVEIDPLDFNMEEKIDAKTVQMAHNNFRPILPKSSENYDYTNEEKMEFFNSGHFLLQDMEKSDKGAKFSCDKCMVRFDSTKALHLHIKQVHSSQYPYKCDYCGMEFAAKDVLKTHITKHSCESSDLIKNSITLTDFTNNSPKINDLITQQSSGVSADELNPKTDSAGEDEVQCNECDRVFASYQGLIRHKAKLHKSYKRKKYFIKGMKTAQCDICNRMFSTNSYMIQHRKLHDRKGGEYRRRIFRQKTEEQENQIEETEAMDDSDDVDMCEEDVKDEKSPKSTKKDIQKQESTPKENDNG